MGRNARPLFRSFPLQAMKLKGWKLKPTLDKSLDSTLNCHAASTPTAESRNRVSGGKKADCYREVVLCDSKEVGADLELDDGELGGESVGVAAAVASAQRNVPQSGELPPDHAQRPGACFPIIF